MKPRNKRKFVRSKTKLGLPDLEQAKGTGCAPMPGWPRIRQPLALANSQVFKKEGAGKRAVSRKTLLAEGWRIASNSAIIRAPQLDASQAKDWPPDRHRPGADPGKFCDAEYRGQSAAAIQKRRDCD